MAASGTAPRVHPEGRTLGCVAHGSGGRTIPGAVSLVPCWVEYLTVVSVTVEIELVRP